MIQTFKELIAYLKNPVLEQDKNTNLNYRLKKFLHLLVISILTGYIMAGLIAITEHFGLINTENHAMADMIKQFPKIVIFGFAVVLAPLLEEVFFRAPLPLFTGKRTFKIAFYIFAILFGYVHLTNYKDITTTTLLISPILVAPQILLGGYLGFIRVRFGLLWSILLHASYNGIIMGIALLSGDFA